MKLFHGSVVDGEHAGKEFLASSLSGLRNDVKSFVGPSKESFDVDVTEYVVSHISVKLVSALLARRDSEQLNDVSRSQLHLRNGRFRNLSKATIVATEPAA